MLKIYPEFTADEMANNLIDRHLSAIAEQYVSDSLASFKSAYFGPDMIQRRLVSLTDPRYTSEVASVYPSGYPKDNIGIEFQELYEKVRDKYKFYELDETEKIVVGNCISGFVQSHRFINYVESLDDENPTWTEEDDSWRKKRIKKHDYVEFWLERANGYENAIKIMNALEDVNQLDQIFPQYLHFDLEVSIPQ